MKLLDESGTFVRERFGHMYMQVCLLKSTVEGQEMSVNYLKSTRNF